MWRMRAMAFLLALLTVLGPPPQRGRPAAARPRGVGRWDRGPAGQDKIVRVVGWYRCRRGATIETVQNLGAVTPLAGTDGGPIAGQSGRSIRQDAKRCCRYPDIDGYQALSRCSKPNCATQFGGQSSGHRDDTAAPDTRTRAAVLHQSTGFDVASR